MEGISPGKWAARAGRHAKAARPRHAWVQEATAQHGIQHLAHKRVGVPHAVQARQGVAASRPGQAPGGHI